MFPSPYITASHLTWDFESGFCGWEAFSTEDSHWEVVEGLSSGEYPFPGAGHIEDTNHGKASFSFKGVFMHVEMLMLCAFISNCRLNETLFFLS